MAQTPNRMDDDVDEDPQVEEEEEGSDLEELEIVVPSAAASAKEIRKVLVDSQLKHSECFKENQRLKRQLAALQAGRKSRRRTQRNLPLPQENLIKSAGRHFATCYEAWSNVKVVLDAPPSGSASLATSPSRYSNTQSDLNAIRHELASTLTSTTSSLLRGTMADEYRIKFEGAMSEQRSNSVSRVSQLSGTIFGPLDNNKRNILLKSDPFSDKYDSLPPVFYKDHVIDSKTVFQSEEIILIRQFYELDIDYTSEEDWTTSRSILHCKAKYHDTPRYDTVLLNSGDADSPVFARLLLLFEVSTHLRSYQLGCVQLFSPAARMDWKDKATGLRRIRQVGGLKGIEIVDLESVIRGVYIVGTGTPGEYYVNDLTDHDIFLRLRVS